MLGYEVTPRYCNRAPSGIPAAIMEKGNREVAHILQLPNIKECFVARGIDLASNTSEAFGALIKGKVPKWRKRSFSTE